MLSMLAALPGGARLLMFARSGRGAIPRRWGGGGGGFRGAAAMEAGDFAAAPWAGSRLPRRRYGLSRGRLGLARRRHRSGYATGGWGHRRDGATVGLGPPTGMGPPSGGATDQDGDIARAGAGRRGPRSQQLLSLRHGTTMADTTMGLGYGYGAYNENYGGTCVLERRRVLTYPWDIGGCLRRSAIRRAA